MFTRRGDATRDLVSSKNRVISTVRSLLWIMFREEKKKEEKKSPYNYGYDNKGQKGREREGKSKIG